MNVKVVSTEKTFPTVRTNEIVSGDYRQSQARALEPWFWRCRGQREKRVIQGNRSGVAGRGVGRHREAPQEERERSLSISAAVTEPHRRGGGHAAGIYFLVLETSKSGIKVMTWLVSGRLLPVSSRSGGTRPLWGPFYKGTNPIRGSCSIRT